MKKLLGIFLIAFPFVGFMGFASFIVVTRAPWWVWVPPVFVVGSVILGLYLLQD